MRSLRFIGDWPFLAGLTAALLLATAAWLYYRRESRHRGDIYGWLLPGLRCLAVLLLVMMLTGPVLHHRWIAGELARIVVLVDSSKSMSVTDRSMTAARKLLNAVQLGYLSDELLPTELLAAQKALGRARLHHPSADLSEEEKLKAAQQLLADLQTGYSHLQKAEFDSQLPATIAKKGTILYEHWNGVSGTDIRAIEKAKGYPNKPSGSQEMNKFQARSNRGDNYASKMSGYVYPPVTGDYVFCIASDDQGWLYLSTDNNPSNKKLLAKVSSYVSAGRWDQNAEQKSKPMSLKAGHRYYIEALHIEGTGEDHVAVGWQLPDGTRQRPIPGRYLSAFKRTETGEPHPATRDLALEQFQRELLGPARELAKKKAPGNSRRFAAQFSDLLVKTSSWQRHLRLSFEGWASKLSQSGAEDVDEAIERIDQMTRMGRVQAMLTQGEVPLLAKLAEEHNIELITFSDTEAEALWRSEAGRAEDALETLSQLSIEARSQASNVGLGLSTVIGLGQAQAKRKEPGESGKLAAVVFSDGRHNYGRSPLHLAKICGSRQIPVFTVAIGSVRKPEDIAIVGVQAPKSVYHKDRVKGKILVKDDMPASEPFTLKIICEGQTLWEKELKTTGAGRRFIEYDFPVEEYLGKKLQDKDRELRYQSLPLSLQAEVSGLQVADAEPGNDSYPFRTRAIFQRNRVLILDGRPRWEYRYVRNLLERDEKWEVTALLADPTAADGGIRRGRGPSMFPSSRDLLYNYGLIVIGDFPAKLFKGQEMEWIRDAVGLRGTGVIFIDGLRKHLQDYAETPLGGLICVRWTGEEPITNPHSLRLTEKGVLRLTEQGTDMAALVLGFDRASNAEIWAQLLPPHWLASIEPLPGSEVLVEAVLKDKQTAGQLMKVPALVFRRFGTGKVLFSAFDETWRWRYRVADEYHQRYWNQMGNLISPEPFAVSDRFVSIDAGTLVYTPGQTALIRAKVRDTKGNPATDVKVKANIFHDGRKSASIPLTLHKDSGQFRGATGTLQPGEYEVKIEVLGYPEDQMLSKAQFYVQRPHAGELAELDCDEQLLRQIAANSGGEFLREEDAGTLANRLKPLSEGTVYQSDTALWQSYPWFAAIVVLLTIEWILRKKAGML